MKLLNSADYIVAGWNFGKDYSKADPKDKLKLSLIDFVKVIDILHKYKIIIPDEYILPGNGIHKINLADKKSYDVSFWKDIASTEENYLRIYFWDCDTIIKENGKLIAYKNYVKVSFNTPLNEKTRKLNHQLREINGLTREVSLTIELMADDWLPYRVINNITRNDDFEYNHGRLKSALIEIEKLGYDYYIEHNNCIAIINNFDLDCHYYEDDISLFDFDGIELDEGVNPKDIT